MKARQIIAVKQMDKRKMLEATAVTDTGQILRISRTYSLWPDLIAKLLFVH
jgi:hypothetical protein